MKYLLELSALINVRNFLADSLENMRVHLTTEQKNAASKQLSNFEKTILDATLKLNINLTTLTQENYSMVFNSTENINTVFDRMITGPTTQGKKETKLKTKKMPSKNSNETSE